MADKTPKDKAASVRQKLLSLARAQGRLFDVVLVGYGLERVIHRLSISAHRDRFILKGGMLVTLWTADAHRVTRDADFLGFGSAAPEALLADFRQVLGIAVDDGLVFDLDGLAATPIREEQEYGGVRLKTVALLGRTRIPIAIDVGFGDALAGAAQTIDYPSLLDLPPSPVRAYPPAAVLAEKLHAVVALGLVNGRMKDFYDLFAVPYATPVADADLDAAIRATFERRTTPIPAQRPDGLSPAFAQDALKRRQWTAYAGSIGLPELALEQVVESVWAYAGPAFARLTRKP